MFETTRLKKMMLENNFSECIKCKNALNQPALYSCMEGHLFCENCFLGIVLTESTLNVCSECGSELLSRNLVTKNPQCKCHNTSTSIHDPSLHDIISSTTTVKPAHNHSHGDSRSFTTITTTNTPKARPSSLAVSNVSKRPVKCPITACKKSVTITQLISHFAFEHSRIPKQNLIYHVPKPLAVKLNNMGYDMSCCIALLTITDDEDELFEPNMAFPLFAAKIRLNTKNFDSENGADLVLIWICGYTEEISKCILEVTDDERSSIHSYYGFINSLRDDNDPVSIFLRGNCLLVQLVNINKLTDNGNCSLELKVVIFP